MGHTVIDLTTSTSTSLNEKNELNADEHFRWESIKKFIYLAYIFSSSITNFDIFSIVLHDRARLLDFIFLELTVGMTYMFMDFFIKQYTRKLDFNTSLNPLLRGISVGLLLQTSVWSLIHATDLAHIVHYLLVSMIEEPLYSHCYVEVNTTCLSTREVVMRCTTKRSVNINTTSVHHHYLKKFMAIDRADMTSRFFVVGIIWVFNFFIATIQETSILKLFKLAFLWKILSTFFLILFIIFRRNKYAYMAVLQIFDVTEYANKPYV